MLTKTLFPIALFALLTACGKPEPAPAEAPPAAASAATATPAAGGDLAKGEKVYKSTCAMCHASGAAGAPLLGNKADWDPRVAQGKDTLYNHAIHGFTGAKGTMPAKGANASLSDDDVKAAVDYMVAQDK
jgi:cytochrome c5